MPNSSTLPGAVTRSPVKQCNEAGMNSDVPEWRKRGFDSKSEMLYVDEYLNPLKMAGEIEYYHEPCSIKLYDGSDERSVPDFFIINMKTDERYWVDVKPLKFIPKEARLGMSKLKRIAKQLWHFHKEKTYKATRDNGHWIHTLIEVVQ